MQTHVTFLQSGSLLLGALVVILSGCSQSDVPAEAEQKCDVRPAAVATPQAPAAPSPPIAETVPSTSAISTPPKHEVTTVDLPAPIDEACVGAGGERLILRLRNLGKLVVFDVMAGKIAGYVSLEDPEDFFAAGETALLVVGRRNRLVKRYSLSNLKQEAEGRIPGETPIAAAGMGVWTRGPLFVVCASDGYTHVVAVDPATLEATGPRMTFPRGQGVNENRARINVSSDGSVFCVTNDGSQNDRILLAVKRDDDMQCSAIHTTKDYACPDDIGSRICLGNRWLPSGGAKLDDDAMPKETHSIPAIGGPYYLRVPLGRQHGMTSSSKSSRKEQPRIQVCLVGESKPIVSLPIEEFPLLNPDDIMLLHRTSLAGRLFLLPHTQVIAELPIKGNTVLLHHLDLDKELQRALPDEPVVVSWMPRTVRVGEPLRHQIQTRSKSGKPVFKLDTGPEGMVVSEQELLEWNPPARLAFNTVGAIVSITDAGRTKYHSMSLIMQPPQGIVATAADGPPLNLLASDKPRGDIRLKLPAVYEDVCVGANGRFLAFTLPSLGKVAVFDVFQAKITGYVPGDGKCLIAASMEKLVVVSPERSVIERFDLQTQKSESKQTLSLRLKAHCIGMGAASHGPILIATTNGPALDELSFVDLDTLKPAASKMPEGISQPLVLAPNGVNVSANGRVFGIRGFHEQYVMTLTDRGLQPTRARDLFGWMLLDETGDFIYSRRGIYTRQLSEEIPADRRNPPLGGFIPAVHGPLYLRLSRDPKCVDEWQPFGVSASVCLAGENLTLATLRNLPFPATSLTRPEQPGEITLNKQVFLIPNAKLIAMLPKGEDTIVLRRFDLNQELERSDRDYLAVVSRPSRDAPPGKKFEYQLDVRSKAGKVSYRLDSSPEGMQVSETGMVRWDAKNPPDEQTAKVQITVTDGSGKSVRHSFALATGAAPKVAASSPGDPTGVAQKASPATPATEHSSGATPVAGKPQAEWRLTKVDDHRLKMSNGDVMLTPGLHYKSMLFLQGEHLAVLSADGMTILRTHKLGEKYHQIAERAEYYVATTPEVIDLLDKKDLATIRRIRHKQGWPVRLAIHPTRPISYVAFVAPNTNANGSFVVVDETNGDIRGSKDYLGQWLEVDAAGQRLVAAGRYEAASSPNVVFVPRPGSPPWGNGIPSFIPGLTRHWTKQVLLVYDLADDGTPLLSSTASLTTGRKDLRMAPDGRRATCITATGNNEAINLDVLDERPIEYAMEGNPVSDLAYHPVLSLVACLGPAVGPVLFERETGQPRPKGLKYPVADLKGATFHHLWFSADGKGLLLDMSASSGGRHLYRVELDLSSADLGRVRRRLPNMTSLGRDLLTEHVPAPGKGDVPLSAIDAFRGGRSQEMSAREVSRAFTDAVVVVQSGQRSGTGFVIGASGYLLTCAHGIREANGVSVSYRSKKGNDVEMKSTPAKIVRIDRAKDLALLKIEGASSLPAVRLAVGTNVETGERVTIISNPGVGQTVLDYTMTEGIVSNTRRRLGRQVLIQTSAAVNPGSSGAPLFNSNGWVIGLVVLKANIEGAGFAVPATDLGAFLATAVKGTGPEAAIERQWVDADGQHEVTAAYLGVRDGAVQLRHADGKESSIPLTKLGPQDQAFLRLMCPDVAGK